MIRTILTIGGILWTGVICAAPEPELNGVVNTPIIQKKYYRGARELFGYKPGFVPNVVTFGPDNEPYIRTKGKHPVIQTLDKTGKWIKLDFIPAIKQRYPHWNGKISTGEFRDERIVFDNRGNAYMIAATGRSNLHKGLLMFSKDRCRSWEIHPLAGRECFRMENCRGDNPPVIVYGNRNKKLLQIVVPRFDTDGKLIVPKPVTISHNSLYTTFHSGGDCVVSAGDKVFVVWPEAEKNMNIDGSTPQFIAVYDRKTDKLSKPVLLGANGIEDTPDPHNLPVLAIDSKGYIHVILGSHHHPFKYMRSLKPLDINGGWTRPVYIGIPKTKKRQGSYTYPALHCDNRDNLHLVSRWAGDRYIFRLVYMMKKPNGKWQEQKYLVVPFRNNYVCWYHKLTADRKGRLFLNYRTFVNHIPRETLDAYDKKWPEEKIKTKQRGKWRGSPGRQIAKFKVKSHDPVVLISDDNGENWRIAVTDDFKQKME